MNTEAEKLREALLKRVRMLGRLNVSRCVLQDAFPPQQRISFQAVKAGVELALAGMEVVMPPEEIKLENWLLDNSLEGRPLAGGDYLIEIKRGVPSVIRFVSYDGLHLDEPNQYGWDIPEEIRRPISTEQLWKNDSDPVYLAPDYLRFRKYRRAQELTNGTVVYQETTHD